MLCPKCNKEMVISVRPKATLFQDGSEHVEVLGRCENCDVDATWEIATSADGYVYEFNLQRYFFG